VKNYVVEPIYTKPYLVTSEDEIVLNYNKMQDIAMSLSMSVNTKAGDIAATAWGPTAPARLIATTGTGRTAYVAGTTGNRKAITKADMINVREAFNKMNLPNLDNLWGLLTPEQVSDIMGISEFVEYDKTGELSKLLEGKVARIMGFNLLMRNNSVGSAGLVYDATAANKRAVDEAIQATDTAAALFWHPMLVRHAEGNAATTINRDRAEYDGGTIISSRVRFGATFDRNDQAGVVALYEAT
jgi:hypothetical protein